MIAQRVAEEIEAEDGAGYGGSGEENEVRRIEEVQAGVVEHGAPTGSGRGNSETEKRECRFSEDHAGHSDSGLHKNGLSDVGQYVAEEDTKTACSEGPRGVDVFAFTRCHDLGADEPRIAGPSTNGESQNQVGKPGTEECGESDGQQDAGEREEGIHREGGQRGVDPAATVAGESADGQTEGERNGNDRDRDGERKSSAKKQARECIAAQFIGSSRVSRGGALEAMDEIDGSGTVGSEPRSRQSAEEKGGEQNNTDDGKRLAAQEIAQGGGCVGFRKRHRQIKNIATGIARETGENIVEAGTER